MAVRVKATRIATVLVLAMAALAGLGASCGDSDGTTTPSPTTNPPPTPAPIERPDPTLRLLVITDLEGYLAPCGCNARPLGGIDRMAAKVAEVRGHGQPTLLVAAGDLFFGSEEHGFGGDGAEVQEIWKAELLVDIFEEMGLAAAVPGALDLSMGVDTFRSLVVAADFPLLAGGLRLGPDAEMYDAPTNLLSETLVRTVGDVKVGLVGVTSMESLAGTLPDGVTRDSALRDAAQAGVAAVREEGADLVVALVRGTRREARQVGALDGVDFVVQGGIDQAEAIPPVDADGAFIFHSGRQGQGLLVVDLFKRGDGAYTDWSDWTTDVERGRLETRMEELRTRLEDWAGDDSVDENDVRIQRARLERMETERRGLRPPATVPGNAFNATWLELPPDASQAAPVTRMIDSYYRRVNENNARVFADLVPEAPAEGQPHYVGSQACGGDCHQGAVDWWTGHAHGRAYATLTELDKEFNLSCVGCHVTGYMKAGGSTVTHNLDGALVNVGCESCHGPGSDHVSAPEEAPLPRDIAEGVCVSCHNQEHSERFVYDAFVQMLVVPGHGRPAAGQ